MFAEDTAVDCVGHEVVEEPPDRLAREIIAHLSGRESSY